jgi:hypothetical protein
MRHEKEREIGEPPLKMRFMPSHSKSSTWRKAIFCPTRHMRPFAPASFDLSAASKTIIVVNMPPKSSSRKGKLSKISETKNARPKRKLLSKLASSDATEKSEGNVDDELCVRRAKLNLDAVLSTRPKKEAGQVALNLGNIAKWSTTSCPFCKFLSEMVPRSTSRTHGDCDGTFALRSIRYRTWAGGGATQWSLRSNPMIGVRSSFLFLYLKLLVQSVH